MLSYPLICSCFKDLVYTLFDSVGLPVLWNWTTLRFTMMLLVRNFVVPFHRYFKITQLYWRSTAYTSTGLLGILGCPAIYYHRCFSRRFHVPDMLVSNVSFTFIIMDHHIGLIKVIRDICDNFCINAAPHLVNNEASLSFKFIFESVHFFAGVKVNPNIVRQSYMSLWITTLTICSRSFRPRKLFTSREP